MKFPALIVDVDGTLAHMGDRSPYDDHLAATDTVNRPVLDTVLALKAADPALHLIVMSGRDAGRSGDVTATWLKDHDVPYDLLLMRAPKDVRKDAIVKRDLYDALIAPFFDVRLVLDDRQQVVDMWRSIGLPTFQVAPGSF